MFKSVSLQPAICRRDMLPADLLKDVQRLLTLAGEYGLVTITLPVLNCDQNLYALAAMTFVMQKDYRYIHETATNISLPPDLALRAQNIALRLMEAQMIVSYLEELDPEYLALAQDGEYCLSFFPQCAILYPEDPTQMSGLIAEAPDKIESRTRACTVILNDISSQHQRALQPVSVLKALEEWRAITGFDNLLTDQGATVSLENPKQMEILLCDNDAISQDPDQEPPA